MSSLRPLDGTAVAVTRHLRTGEPPPALCPEQRITLERALAAYTAGVAYQAFEEQVAGRLAVGQRADLCLLATDPRCRRGRRGRRHRGARHLVGRSPSVPGLSAQMATTWAGRYR